MASMNAEIEHMRSLLAEINHVADTTLLKLILVDDQAKTWTMLRDALNSVCGKVIDMEFVKNHWYCKFMKEGVIKTRPRDRRINHG